MHSRSTRLVIGAFVCTLLSVTASFAQTLPSSEQVLTKLRLVNDQFLHAWPDPAPDIVTDRARPSNIWTRATYFEGLMALHKIAPDPRYTAYAARWSESHDWNLAYGSTTNRNADDQCCGQTYLDLYALDPRPERIAKIKTAIDHMVNSTKRDDWWWIDALQMAMPVFARLGVITGDPRYFTAMHEFYSHTRSVQGGNGLYNPVEHLWWRDADFDPPYTEPNGAHCYWARGNGWVLAALVRVLDVLPANHPLRAEYLRTFQDMAAALVPLQRADGFWNVSLKDPDNYGGRELTGTAFFAYGMAWGIRHGHLSRATYLPVVAKSWRALADLAVRPDGTLGYVQGTGKQPSDSQPVTYSSAPNFDDFGTGAFLLAGTEVYQLANTPAVDSIGLWRETLSAPVVNPTITPIPTPLSTVSAVIRIRGTALANAFASPPRLTLPDGVTSIALTYDRTADEWSYRERSTEASPVPTTPRLINGNYTLAVGETLIRNLILDEATPPHYVLRAWSPIVSATAPFTITTTQDSPGGEAELNIALTATNAMLPAIEATSASLSPGLASCSLLVPAYTLQPGTYTLSTSAITRSTPRTNVDLGPLGTQATIEAGCRWIGSGLSVQVGGRDNTGPRVVNLSSRGLATADDPLIAGFVISPGGPKMVLIRAVGPSLQSLGVTGALANPTLRVFNSNRTRAWQSDDWQSTPQYLALTPTGATALLANYTNVRDATLAAREAGAFPLTARSRDAALVLVLPPGNYTAQVTPSGNSAAGTALVEVYELTTTQTNPRLTNLSTRGTVSTTDSLTAGFVVTGGPKRVLLRAIGPTLAAVGLPATSLLRDPKLAVFDAAGVQVAQNDNWSDAPNASTQATFRASLGAFALPAASKDAEAMLTLNPGAYTILVSSVDGTAGTALVEVYTEPPGS